jgi:hypothetical protein
MEYCMHVRHSAVWLARTSSLILTLATVAGAQQSAGGASEPLAPFAGQKVSVMPIQFLRVDTTAPVKAQNWAAVRRELDDSIGVAIAERGIGKKWAYAADIERMAKRNAVYVSDPYSLGAGALRNRAFKPGDQAPPTLINNLRSMIALGDSRYALIPVELGFAGAGAEKHPVLRLVLLDGRVGQITWYADLPGVASAGFASADIGALAQRIADLVVAR